MTDPIVADVTALVRSVFGGREVFSCITGSTAAGTTTATSDIDIVVVLDDQLPVARAHAMRVDFTLAYLDLHRRHDRPPDRNWPGEVCYLRDLDAAINGAAFTAGHDALHPAGPDCSFRYWLAMVATGLPTTGREEFAHHARRCATTLARHAILAIGPNPTGRARRDVALATCETVWRLPPLTTPSGAMLRETLDAELVVAGQRGHDPLHRWRTHLAPPSATPALDRFISTWRTIAHRAE